MADARERTFLREWRRYRGLTQEAVAEQSGVSHSMISRIERGLVPYGQHSLEALASLYGCRPADLLQGPPGSGAMASSPVDRLTIEELKVVEAVARLLIAARAS